MTDRRTKGEVYEECLGNIKNSIYYYKLNEIIINTYDELIEENIMEQIIDISFNTNNPNNTNNIFNSNIEKKAIYYLFLSFDTKDKCEVGLFLNDKLIEDSISSNSLNYDNDNNILMVQILILDKNDKIEIKNILNTQINYEIKSIKLDKINMYEKYENISNNMYENIYFYLKNKINDNDSSEEESDNEEDLFEYNFDLKNDSNSNSVSIKNLNRMSLESNEINNQLMDYNLTIDSNSESNTFSKLDKFPINYQFNINSIITFVINMLFIKYNH